jgi:hypothetical protein
MQEPDGGLFLIVDYNLSRVADVAHISDYVRARYGAKTVLVRPAPSAVDEEICDEVVDLDPLRPDFVDQAYETLAVRADQFRAGIVFSDNAVYSGAALLRRLGLRVDDPELAYGAFCKIAYRSAETRHRELLDAQDLLVPDFAEVAVPTDVQRFADRHPEGFVVKPAKEGNNRGVVVLRPGDDPAAAFAEAAEYLAGGIVCEQFIPYRREYSFDGVGAVRFVTEKVSAEGRYPVEVAQILPAAVSPAEHAAIERAGLLANLLVGQHAGPFHNEIKLSDDGRRTAVVEPNRRPAGMKIWSLAREVYAVDLYDRWVDAAFGVEAAPADLRPRRSAATVMLGVRADRDFSPADVDHAADPFGRTLRAVAARHGLPPGALTGAEFDWLVDGRRRLHAVARDNADFAAQACLILEPGGPRIHEIVRSVRELWPDALEESYRERREV